MWSRRSLPFASILVPPSRSFSEGRLSRFHVAIVGSGPAGFYTTKYLLKQSAIRGGVASLHIHMFEQLPTPFGLVRFGVAPDHPEVKNVIRDFTEVAKNPSFRFFGNVRVGSHIQLEDLRRQYDAVVVCTGAQGERHLGIPGEHLQGVVGAPALVQWYNGHPDFSTLSLREPGEAAVVVGQGNVALDIARILARSPKELHATDIDAGALARIAEWQQKGLQTIHVVGRRGFVQSAFTNKELRELTSFEEVLPVIDPHELDLCRNPASEEELGQSRMKKRSLAILEKMASNFADRERTSKRVIWLRFLSSPSAILPNAEGRGVAGIRLERTVLRGEPGKQVAVPAEPRQSEDVACGLVLRSVGFDLVPMPGLPSSSPPGVRVPHQQGRVEKGLYVSGWAKRGPTGVIASNLSDAQETAARVAADVVAQQGGGGSIVGDPGAAVEAILESSGARVVSFADWRTIEAEETRRGTQEGKAASKLTEVSEMLSLLQQQPVA